MSTVINTSSPETMILTQSGTVTLRELNKSDINKLASNLVQKVKDGEIAPDYVLANAAKLAHFFGEVVSGVRELAVPEIEKFQDRGDIELHGVTFSLAKGKKEYDYSVSSDWLRFKSLEEDAADKRKGVETALKAADYVNQTTGEITSKLKPSGYGKPTVRVSF